MDLSSGLAVRVAALCLDPGGRVSDKLLHHDAVRGALVLDLVLAGRLAMTDDAVVVDQVPTGFPPADRLLAAIDAEPERSLDDWLDERRIGLRDVVPALVDSGRWAVRRRALPGRRFADRQPEATARDLARRPARWSLAWSAADCCVAVVADAGGLLERASGTSEGIPPVLLDATGIGWAAGAVVEHLQQAAQRYLTERVAFGSGLGF